MQTSWSLPTIHPKRCTGCGICTRLCPTQAVDVRDNLAVIVRPDACSFCDICETYCPEAAIERPFTITFASSTAPTFPRQPERAADDGNAATTATLEAYHTFGGKP